MDWKHFKEKYKPLIEDFNSLDFDERKKVSLHGQCDVIAELIRTKNILKESINKLDSRINILSKSLDKELKERQSNP